eukprot:2300035-Rhodomonas_salina.1
MRKRRMHRRRRERGDAASRARESVAAKRERVDVTPYAAGEEGRRMRQHSARDRTGVRVRGHEEKGEAQ